MTFMFVRNIGLLAVFSALCILAWMWTVPGVMFGSTFASFVVFLLGAAAVSLTAWSNGQATPSVGQLLHATEAGAGNVEARKRLNTNAR